MQNATESHHTNPKIKLPSLAFYSASSPVFLPIKIQLEYSTITLQPESQIKGDRIAATIKALKLRPENMLRSIHDATTEGCSGSTMSSSESSPSKGSSYIFASNSFILFFIFQVA